MVIHEFGVVSWCSSAQNPGNKKPAAVGELPDCHIQKQRACVPAVYLAHERQHAILHTADERVTGALSVPRPREPPGWGAACWQQR